jgi:hypothetical protein
MAITAKSRSQLALTATSRLAPDQFLRLVTKATEMVRGGGASLLTSGLQNIGAQVQVRQESPNALDLSIVSLKRMFELSSFTAEATRLPDGRTRCQLGGLDTYRTSQPVIFGFIPFGPKAIAGYDLYKRFLTTVAELLETEDPGVAITIMVPEG